MKKIFFTLALLAMVLSTYFYINRPENIICDSDLHLYSDRGHMDVLFKLQVINGNYGFITMKGIYIDNDGVNVPFRIKKEFSVQKKDDLYVLSSNKKNLTDNDIAEKPWARSFFPTFFYSNNDAEKYIIRLDKLNKNAWFFSVSNTPILLCER